MEITVRVSDDDIIDSLGECNDYERLFGIIKALDLRVGDWSPLGS